MNLFVVIAVLGAIAALAFLAKKALSSNTPAVTSTAPVVPEPAKPAPGTKIP